MTLAFRFWRAPYLLLALAALFWSGNFVVGRAVASSLPPVGLAFWRWAAATALVLVVARSHLGRDLGALRADWRIVVALAVLGVSAFNTLVYIGLHTTTAINGLVLQSAIPVFIVVCSFILYRDRAGPGQLFGILLSLAGVAVIAGQGSAAALRALSVNRGDGWVLAAVIAYALYSALLRKRPPVHPLSLLAATFSVGTVLLLPFYIWEQASGSVLRVDGEAILAIAYVALFPGFLSYLFYNRGVELIGASRAGQFIHLMPVFGSLMAIAFLGESLRGFHLAGFALIGAGIGLATLGKRGP